MWGGGERDGEGAESYDSQKAWSSINHEILFGKTSPIASSLYLGEVPHPNHIATPPPISYATPAI